MGLDIIIATDSVHFERISGGILAAIAGPGKLGDMGVIKVVGVGGNNCKPSPTFTRGFAGSKACTTRKELDNQIQSGALCGKNKPAAAPCPAYRLYATRRLSRPLDDSAEGAELPRFKSGIRTLSPLVSLPPNSVRMNSSATSCHASLLMLLAMTIAWAHSFSSKA
jgi:hypothetical protein